METAMKSTVLENHQGITVIRDDLYPGGSKARFVPELFKDAREVVYASPAQGGAQYALAHVARDLGKQATIFVAERSVPHPRQLEAKALGAKIVLVPFGMLSNVQAKARAYAQEVGATLCPFGMDTPLAIEQIATAAISFKQSPDEVWCAAGSGTLSRALQKAWPDARHFAIAVGRNIPQNVLGNAKQIRYPKPFEAHAKIIPPFPADPHYEAKAWEFCLLHHGRGKRVLFWNVAGPAVPPIVVPQQTGMQTHERKALDLCIKHLDAIEPAPGYFDANNPARGKCHIASVALHQFLGGFKRGYRFYKADYLHAGKPDVHYWIVSPRGVILDPTAMQYTDFGQTPPYQNGRRISYQPNYKRHMPLLERMQQVT
jgi:hypothetical protein